MQEYEFEEVEMTEKIRQTIREWAEAEDEIEDYWAYEIYRHTGIKAQDVPY